MVKQLCRELKTEVNIDTLISRSAITNPTIFSSAHSSLPQCKRNKHPTKSKTTPFFLPCPKKSKQSHEERLLPLAEKNCQTSLVLYVRYGLQKYPKQEAKFITKADFHNVCNSCSVTLEKCPVTNLHGTPLTCFFCRPLLDTNLDAAS